MLVSEVLVSKGITFDMVSQIFMVDYTTEDAERFWDSKWSDIQNTWLFYSPIHNLFFCEEKSIEESLTEDLPAKL